MTITFLETPRFPEWVKYDYTGGPMYNTAIETMASGAEQRNVNWDDPLCHFQIVHIVTTSGRAPNLSTSDELTAFFRSMKGRAYGFRFKDWFDYQATHEQKQGKGGSLTQGLLGSGVGTGARTYQMYKYYAVGALDEFRLISKPVSGTVTIKKAGSTVTPSIDTTTGLVTFAVTGKAITGITKASNASITCIGHGFNTGDKVEIAGVAGMTQINGLIASVTVTDADHFTTGINSSSFSTYTSGGSAYKGPQPSESLTWAGEFDIPVRFDADQPTVGSAGFDVLTWSIPIVEIRL